jgi:hypothetical protein
MNPARQKVEEEGCCRVCGEHADRCDAAHLWDRSLGGGDFADPDLCVPLCSRVKGGLGCHDLYDSHKLDILHLLTLTEQVALVSSAKSILRAFERATGHSPFETVLRSPF